MFYSMKGHFSSILYKLNTMHSLVLSYILDYMSTLVTSGAIATLLTVIGIIMVMDVASHIGGELTGFIIAIGSIIIAGCAQWVEKFELTSVSGDQENQHNNPTR